MLIEQGVFGPAGALKAAELKAALRSAYTDFTRWRQLMKLQCSHRPFTIGGLYCDGYGLFLASKGYNARVLAEWIRHLLEVHPTADPRHENTLKCFNSITRYFALTERASRHLFGGCTVERNQDFIKTPKSFRFLNY